MAMKTIGIQLKISKRFNSPPGRLRELARVGFLHHPGSAPVIVRFAQVQPLSLCASPRFSPCHSERSEESFVPRRFFAALRMTG
ncbi:MAG: hypothetical protein ABI465_05985, partial [Ktedonobacteraceae bacterium]